MKVKAWNFEGQNEVLAELRLKAEVSRDANDFCADVVKLLRGIIDIETLILFTVVDDLNLEMSASHGRSFAILEEGRFLKSHMKTPITEAIRLQKNQAWNNTRKVLLEFPDLVEWPRIMPSVVGIPIVREGVSVAGCSYVLQHEFSLDHRDQIVKILEETAELIYSVYQREHGL